MPMEEGRFLSVAVKDKPKVLWVVQHFSIVTYVLFCKCSSLKFDMELRYGHIFLKIAVP